jgi:DNA-binding transcriptional ArsR family regulator
MDIELVLRGKFMDENEMVDFVKAIADADRLRIVGLLTQKPARLSEINELLGFHPADTQHHLDRLMQSGVVHLTDGIYELDIKALEQRLRRQFEGKHPAYAPESDVEKKRWQGSGRALESGWKDQVDPLPTGQTACHPGLPDQRLHCRRELYREGS